MHFESESDLDSEKVGHHWYTRMYPYSLGTFTGISSSADRVSQLSVSDDRKHHKETGFMTLKLDSTEYHVAISLSSQFVSLGTTTREYVHKVLPQRFLPYPA